MSVSTIQELLPLVETPSRYLGNEINTVHKDLSSVDLRIALAFPDLYEIGTSHFGIQILYDILNRHPRIAAERVFAPANDMAAYLKARGIPLASLESGVPLREFDIIGFSLLYELNYTNLLEMLDLAGIPFFSRERKTDDPFVIAGGPCTCNPEPVADFFDAMVFGDGEAVVTELSERWLKWRKKSQGREDLLRAWSEIEGVYIPGFFEPHDDIGGFQRLAPRFDDYRRVRRAIVEDLNVASFPERPVLPYGRPVHDRLRIELSRGCTRGCRFCQAGMLYRPVRERSPDRVLDLCDIALGATGYEDISLLSLSTGDYTCLTPLLEQMMTRYGCDHVAVSLPSIRAGALTPELMALIKEVRKTGFTIAPEAGSQRLRDVINKNVSAKQIRDTVSGAFGLGWNLIKLYFMVGLPTETLEDLEELVALVDGLRKTRGPDGRFAKINVSVATLIPKPHTPFQWAAQIPLDASREKIEWLQEKLRMPGVKFKWQQPEMSYLEGLMARGDRRLSDVILSAYRRGCRFDGWSDQFRFDLWKEAIAEVGVDPDFFLTRCRQTDEPLPWDHIDSRVTKDYLLAEWEAALQGGSTGDCRGGKCNNCGVCDFDTLEPRIFKTLERVEQKRRTTGTDDRYRKVEVSFSKTGAARLFGHLEMVNIFARAMKRGDIPVRFTKGFHPKPKMVFQDALPIGMESLREVMVVDVEETFAPAEIARQLNRELPEGLAVIGCAIAGGGRKGSGDRLSTYRVTLARDTFDADRLEAFEAANHFLVEKRGKKGRLKKIDLKAMVRRIQKVDDQTLEIDILSREGVSLRPAELLASVFGMDRETVRTAAVVRLASIPGEHL